ARALSHVGRLTPTEGRLFDPPRTVRYMDLTKALFEGFATFLGGAAATVLFLMPGYVMSKAFSGGVRGLAPTDRAFLATTASGGLLTHLLVLWWTVPLFRSISEGLPVISAGRYLEVLL